jgi:hypothetical protein
MPVTGRRVTERVIKRIRESEYTLRVYYPIAKTKPTGTTPVSLPVSPLLPAPRPQAAPGEDPERILPELALRCLFTEVSLIGEYRRDRMEVEVGGWSRETTALARVVATEADRPDGGTVFDGCDFVEVQGRRYKVLNVVKQSASTTSLGTYYVLLTGAAKS